VDRLTRGGGIGGLVAHFCANAAGLGPLLGDAAIRVQVQSFLDGVIGGGSLAAYAGALMKKSQADGCGGCYLRPAPLFYSASGATTATASRLARTPSTNGIIASAAMRAASRNAAPAKCTGAPGAV